MLAARYGVRLEDGPLSSTDRRKQSEREHLLQINAMALDYFRWALTQDRAGQNAGDYLKRRGISQDTIETFRLGYVPDGWDHLIRYFQKKKVTHAQLIRSGLILESEKYKGRFYDRFRNRIIFPIFNHGRQVIGFGGRVMDDSKPKYLNSPETLVYNKRRSLYGFHESRRICRAEDTVYIVEGYFDFLALWQHGIRNVVATLGTALSSEHMLLLKGAGRNLVLVYDSDAAGIKAALRCVDMFLNDLPIITETPEKNMEPRILILPQGHDPDSYVFKFGSRAFETAARKAPALMTFLMDTAIERHGLSVDGKLRVVEALQEPLAKIGDDFARSLYVRELAERLGGMEESAILERVRRVAAQKRKLSNPPVRSNTVPSPPDGQCRETVPPQAGTCRLEKRIVAMILQFPQIIPAAKRRDVLGYIEHPDHKTIVRRIFEQYDTSCAICVADLMSEMDNDAHRRLISSLAVEEEAWALEGCLKLLDQFVENCGRARDDLTTKIKTAEKQGDQEQLFQLLREKQRRAEKIFKTKRVEPAGGKTI